MPRSASKQSGESVGTAGDEKQNRIRPTLLSMLPRSRLNWSEESMFCRKYDERRRVMLRIAMHHNSVNKARLDK